MTTVFTKAFRTSILLGCISSSFQGKAHATVIMKSPSTNYDYHRKDHRNRDEVLVVICMLSYEVDSPWWRARPKCSGQLFFRDPNFKLWRNVSFLKQGAVFNAVRITS